MKRNRIRRFIQQRQYAIASLILFIAIAAMTGVYFSNRITSERQEEELARKEGSLLGQDSSGQEDLAAFDAKDMEQFMDQYVEPDADDGQAGEEDVTSVTSVIQPQNPGTDADNGTDSAGSSGEQGQQDGIQGRQGQEGKEGASSGPEKQQGQDKQETAAKAKAPELHFSAESVLGWPLQGDVILNYSMDQTVFFPTLEQYKYNPAIIIAGKVNDPVKAAATGKITDISANEETGMTVTMDLGDGYSAVYGQLKEVLYKEGAIVEAGNAIGYIAEPTKYYSVEGSNLYFALKKDDEPADPMQFME